MDKKRPLISVAMATYNGEKFLASQLDSIISQSYPNVELIICDDGSTDQTVHIIEEYQKRYPFIKLYQNRATLGFVKNFEKAISLCTGDYIALSDQDDIWLADKLEKTFEKIQAKERLHPHQPVMAHSDLTMIDEKDQILHHSYFDYKSYKLKKGKDLGHIAGPCGVMGNTLLFNRDLQKKILPFPDMVEFHDYWIALINELFGHRITLHEPLVQYRIHTKNTSNSGKKLTEQKVSLNSLFHSLASKITPPFLNSRRDEIITHLLTTYPIDKEDTKTLSVFLDYLKGRGGKLMHIYHLLHNSLLKRDLAYRIAVVMNYLMYNQNTQKCNETKEMNRQQALFFGFSRWKHSFIKPFFKEYQAGDIQFINPLLSSHLRLAQKKGLDPDTHIYFWGRKSFPDIEAYAAEHRIPIYRVEDGFIRSIALGSDLTQPYSQVVDKKGIYFDPTQPSDLEEILNHFDFDQNPELIQRAKKVKEQIILNKISKYNADSDKKLHFPVSGKTIALVAGQVEDDASIQYGANGMTNLELLQKVRSTYPDRYIVFKPHPDVLSGNRIGHVDKDEALKYCDTVMIGTSMASILQAVDEVHTMTSLTGFEALVYGKKVYTYGMPFYAGWGLTIDEKFSERRKRTLTVDALIAATYILYPRYISPKTKAYCSVEEVIEELKFQKEKLEASGLLKTKSAAYRYISRITQKLLSFIS